MGNIKQQGSAITEFVITMFALVPIFLLFSLVGKLGDTQNAAQQGARYQAWEVAMTGAQNNSADELKLEVHQRVLNSNEFIESVAPIPTTVEEHPNRHLWAMPATNNPANREALVSFDQEGYQNNLRNSGAGLGLFALSFDVPGIGDVGISDIDRNGLYDAKIGFAINDVSALEYNGQVPCGYGSRDSYLTCMERNNAILVDDWSAASPGQVQRRVQKLNPALSLWEPFAELVHDVADPPFPLGVLTPAAQWYRPFNDIKAIDQAPGFVLPDLVPQRNLGRYEDVGITEELD